MQTEKTTSAQTASELALALIESPWLISLLGGLLVGMPWSAMGTPFFVILGLGFWWFALIKTSTLKLAWTASFLFGCAWLGVACLWMRVFGPVPFVALIGIEAAIIGFVGLAGWYWRHHPWRFITVPLVWMVVEAGRSAVPFGGFSWAQLNHSIGTDALFVPLAMLFGSWGLTVLLVALGVLVGESFAHRIRLKTVLGAFAGVTLVIMAMPLIRPLFIGPEGKPIHAAIIQAGDVSHTFAAGISAKEPKDERVIDKVAAQYEQFDPTGLDLILWPENSLDNDPETVPWLKEARDRLLAKSGSATVFAGQNSHTPEGELTNVTGVYREGKQVTAFIKLKLVPFGEFFPYPELLGWVPSAQLIGHMVPGDGPDSTVVAGHEVGGVICYESAYPSMINQAMTKGASVLVVSTNNASFADTRMKDQHLSISRLRAAEYGRPVIHGSLSGPSAFFDPSGKAGKETFFAEGATITQVIQPMTGTTPAMVLNPILPWAGALSLVLLSVLAYRQQAPLEETETEPQD